MLKTVTDDGLFFKGCFLHMTRKQNCGICGEKYDLIVE